MRGAWMRRSIAPRMCVPAYLRAEGVWDDVDFADIAFAIDRGCLPWRFSQHEWRCAWKREWRPSLGLDRVKGAEQWEREIAPQFTFEILAAFLVRRIAQMRIEPAEVLGRPCTGAGAFRLLQRVARSVQRRAVRFGPSTRVETILRGHELRLAWERWRWASTNRLPPLRRVWSHRLRDVWGWIIAGHIGLLLAIVVGVQTGWWTVAQAWCGGAAVMGSIAVVRTMICLLEHCENPLPEDLHDFRAVAKAMVAR